MISQDEYKTVFNSNETYKHIADYLLDNGPIFFAWTDQAGTQLDILMVYRPGKIGPVQGGLRGDDLFVSVMRFGAFGFAVTEQESFAGYIGEKLRLGGVNTTTEKLAELINGVRKELLI